MKIVLNIFKIILNIILTLFIVLGSAFIILFFIGIEPFVVQSGSMSPTIETGSVSFINKRVQYEEIKQNDVIAFTIDTGDKVTHRVYSITDKGIKTKGDANEDVDGMLVTSKNYIGKNVFSIPKVGYIVKRIQSPKGKLVTLGIVIILFACAFFLGKEPKGKHEDKGDSKNNKKSKIEENKEEQEN